MRVELGKFARDGLESQLGSDVETGVHTALVHYVQRLKFPRKPAGPPQFLDGMPPASGEPEVIELPLEADAEAALHEEAVRHQISIGEVLVHAVLTYLADRDLATSGDSAPREIAPDAPLL